jgi:hypothetical protein
MAEQELAALGRKVFFLYPPSVIQEELIHEIVKNGYEVYTLRDHNKTLELLKEYSNSILFINIDQGIPEEDWPQFVFEIKNNPAMADVRIGILSYNLDPKLIELYLWKLKVQCGFIHLKTNQKESLDIILNALELNGARGRRKHIRAKCMDDYRISLSIKCDGNTYTGKVLDISISGMACTFDKDPPISAGSILHEIQLNLRGSICRISGLVTIIRGEVPRMAIIMFPEKTDESEKDKIYQFIFNNFQHLMEQKLKTMP